MISKVVSDAITDFVVTDLHLPDIVEGRGFQRLIATLRSPCEIPGKFKLEQEIIPRIYESTRTSVINTIANSCSTFALGIEEWTCSSSNVYVSISIFFQQVIIIYKICDIMGSLCPNLIYNLLLLFL